MQRKREEKDLRGELAGRCLAAFIRAGSMDVSLDQLAEAAGSSKRMLVHYFGGREALEEEAMMLLEERLRAQFAPQNFPPGVSSEKDLHLLWEMSIAPQSKGVLLLIMDLSRRAWNGSARAKAFYGEQQRLWEELLVHYLPDRYAVRDVLQSFQGAVLGYLITGDAEPGRKMMSRFCEPASKRVGKRRR